MANQNLLPAGDNLKYNNCFTLGEKCWRNGRLIKVPVFIDHYDDTIQNLYGSKNGDKRKYYELSYEEARTEYYRFRSSENWEKSSKALRISLWLDNAMFGNLHIFVIDFDEFDVESHFFKEAHRLADKVTRSQGGGYHMFYGVDKEKAEPLFDSINLLASENAASFVCKTGAVTRDGANKVDLFCDTGHFIYEWEPWDNTIGLTDKTQELYQLIKENFSLEKSKSYKQSSSGNTTTQHRWTTRKSRKKVASNSDAEYQGVIIEGKTESELKSEMTDKQREIFEDLKNISADCNEGRWTSVAYDIWFAFQTDDGDELAAQVFLWWSKRGGESYEPFQCVRKWEFVNELCSNGQRTLSNGRWQAIMCRGEVVNEGEIQQQADVPVDNPTLPLPLEDDTSAALEEAAAEPTFRDLPIAWENVTTEENGKQRTGHWIVWNGNRSKREEFFKLTFPNQYNKVKKRVKFLGQAADDVLRLTGGQRTKLMYEILAWKYGLEEVDEQDSLDLIWFCKREEDNKTADDLLSRLYWPNGLSKLVTFGVGMKLDGAAQQTWCYSVDYQEDRALFTGSSMTWERWQVKLIEVLDRCRACRYSYSKMWKQVRPTMYYQFDRYGRYLTLTQEDCKAITEWINEYFVGGSAPFPLSGAIPAADYKFVIDYNTDVEFVDNRDLKAPGEMAKYNQETNAARNKEKGKKRVQERFSAACGAVKIGDTLTTNQLVEMGYTDDKARKRLIDSGVLKRIKRGYYLVLSV